jgi:hypothetical protein
MNSTTPGPLAVGYGAHYRASFLRPLPVFAGQPYQLDAVSMMDARVSEEQVPDGVMASVENCRMKSSLIPPGDAPFQLRSAYDPTVEVFGTQSQQVFLRNYRLMTRGVY